MDELRFDGDAFNIDEWFDDVVHTIRRMFDGSGDRPVDQATSI